MSPQVAILLATAVLAVVAVSAALVAVRALREVKAIREAPASAEIDVLPVDPGVSRAEPQSQREPEPEPAPEAEVVRVVEGRVIVQPSQDQIVAATMTRLSVRLGILASGVAHALRPESRDRITALMRREYRSRKRSRQRAARAAGRGWVGS